MLKDRNCECACSTRRFILVEPLLHFSIPFSAFILGGASPRKALLASSFAVFPDLDVLAHVHRSMSHSALVLVAIVVPVVILTSGTKYRNYVLLAAAGLLSHVLLDLFTGFTPVLWPLYDRSVWLLVSSATHIMTTPSITFSANMLTQPTSFDYFETMDAPLFTSTGLIISALLLTPVFIRLSRSLQKFVGFRR